MQDEAGKERAKWAPLGESFPLEEGAPGSIRFLVVACIWLEVEEVKEQDQVREVALEFM
jgi:hypothetical protein